jgi:hypothetical protein
MRNIFDQYSQPENRLTHALVCTLSKDRRLIRPFLKWLKIGSCPQLQGLRLVEQQIPGVAVSGDEIGATGLPDACIFNDEGWALLVESKVQAPIRLDQLERHLKTAAHHGYENANLIVIAVNRIHADLPDRAKAVEWREVYRWFRKQAVRSEWARMFVDYMQILESQMIAKEYLKQGTLTMFDGLCFDKDNPYTHREGKRLLRLLRDELQQRKDLQELGVDPTGEGRSAITGQGFSPVWNYLSLKQAKGETQHTAFPHLSLEMNSETALAAVTVPNGVKGGFRTRLEKGGLEGFRSLIAVLEVALRPTVMRSKGAKPFICVNQRHFPSQRSAGIKDGRLDVDIRTLAGCPEAGIKCQPEWIDAIYEILTHKRANIEFGIEVHFSYCCPVVRSRKVVDLYANTWTSLKPLLDFAFGGE